MKIAIAMTLALVTIVGCKTADRGGSTTKNEGFWVTVSAVNKTIKQGEIQTIVVYLERGSRFKQDVTLSVKAAKGISVEPRNVQILASEKGIVQLQITAPNDAALGEYPVVVTITPEIGSTASVGFTVKVVSP